MAKKERLTIVGSAREFALNSAMESRAMRSLRIDGSCNGATLRTRVVKDKKHYNRNSKHKKSFADAGDFPILCPQIINNMGSFLWKDCRERLFLLFAEHLFNYIWPVWHYALKMIIWKPSSVF